MKINNHNFYIKRENYLKKKLKNKKNYSDIKTCKNFSEFLYNKGYSCLDIIDFIKKDKNKLKYNFLVYYDIIKSEIRDEKLLLLIILNLYFMRKKFNLENIKDI